MLELIKKHPRIYRILKSFLLIFVLVNLLLPVAFVHMIAYVPRAYHISSSMKPDWLTAKEFTTSQNSQIHVWDSESENKPALVIQHGLADWKASMLGEAQLARDLGCRVIMPDLRGHGLSGEGLCTLGVKESKDLLDVLKQMELADKRLILWGRSLGGATVALAAPHLKNLEAIILDSCYDTIWNTINAHRELIDFPIPEFPTTYLTFWYLKWWVSEDLDGDGNIVEALKKLDCPALIIGGTKDPAMTPVVQQRLFAACRNPASKLWLVEGADHVEAFNLHRAEFSRRVKELVNLVRDNK